MPGRRPPVVRVRRPNTPRPVRCVVFGAGSAGERLIDALPAGYEVVAFVDNSAAKHGTTLRGRPVLRPEQLSGLHPERVLIASMYADAIHQQLLDMGVAGATIAVASGPQQRVTSDPFPIGCALMLVAMLSLLAFGLVWWLR